MLQDPRLDEVFGALSNPTRRAIIARLTRGEATVNDLVEPFEMSQPAISRHLKVLEEAGLILRGRDGQTRPCRLTGEGFRAAGAWLASVDPGSGDTFPGLEGLMRKLGELGGKLV